MSNLGQSITSSAAVDYSELAGFLSPKAVGILESQHRREAREFNQLCRRLSWNKSAKKRWATLDAETKAAIVAYRKRWREEHRDQYNAAVRRAKQRRRRVTELRLRENAEKRSYRAAAIAARKAAERFVCAGPGCGREFGLDPAKRIPSRRPKYCSGACQARANYQRGKASRKPWALRTKEFRKGR